MEVAMKAYDVIIYEKLERERREREAEEGRRLYLELPPPPPPKEKVVEREPRRVIEIQL
jgi:hypothetical protein